MSTSYKIITPVDISAEPVSVSELKSWLRIDWPDDDALMQLLISRARAFCETITGRALATQVVQQVDTIERPIGGTLYGSINPGPNWYQYQEEIGANPFGPAQFYFDLAKPPIQANQPITVETKVTAFDSWVTFSGNTYVDDNREPARMYFQVPVTANFWRFTFTAGYVPNVYSIPFDLKQAIIETAAYWFDNRQAADVPQAIMTKLLARRVEW